MKLQQFVFSAWAVNTYVVWDPSTLQAAIIDPACNNDTEWHELCDFIDNKQLLVERLIVTHGHLDHTFGIEQVMEHYGVILEAGADDANLLANRQMQADMFHYRRPMASLKIGAELHDGDIINIGSGELLVIAVPGHSPGSIALYDKADGWVITGDALFQGSIGRTDLPGGDYDTLIRSIRSRLMTLPATTRVYPGHGPSSTIAAEHRLNPYI